MRYVALLILALVACNQTIDNSAKNKGPVTRPMDEGEDVDGYYAQTIIPKGETFTIVNGKTKARINGDQSTDLRVKLIRVKPESLTNGSEVLLGNSAVSEIIRIEVYDAEQEGNVFADQTKLAPIEIFTTVETETPDALSVSYVDKTQEQPIIAKVSANDITRTAALHLAASATDFSFPLALSHATIAVVEDETINAVIKVAQRNQSKNSISSQSSSGNTDTTTDDDPNEIRMQLDGSVHFNCLLRETGKLRCWGGGLYGKLGTGDAYGRTPGLNSSAPLVDIDLGTGKLAKSFTMGREHACALLTDGSVKCWGQNQNGQLGIIPVPASPSIGDDAAEMGDNLSTVNFGTGRTAVKIASASQSHHTCAVLDNGTVKCWGRGDMYQLGTGANTDYGDQNTHLGNSWPAVPNPTGTKAVDVAVGSRFTCILFDDKRVRCFGENTDGQLGFNSNDFPSTGGNGFGWGTTSDLNSLQPVSLSSDLSTLYPVSIHATKVNVCAVMNNNTIKCWGDNSMGQLGHNEATSYQYGVGYPAVISSVRLPTSDRIMRFSMGSDSSCYINQDYKLKCWGYGGHGRLGNESTTSYGLDNSSMGNNLPTVNLGTGRLALEVGGSEAWCVLLDNLKFKCFGLNDFGQAGSMSKTTDSPGSMGDNLPYQPL